MSAFCPYAKEVEIDFDEFENKGLFLISGETGAGKTAIFDGISYALYGKVSGQNRGIDCLRSDFANADTPTFVKLTFEHRGTIYQIKRSPKYMRPKKRGNDGFTEEAATVEFTTPDKVFTNSNDVEAKIIELLGITHQQFKQIVMIAQGEFLNLLLSDSKDRGKILRKIFDTSSFEQIQSALKNKLRELETQKKEIDKSVMDSYRKVLCDADKKIEFDNITSNVYNLSAVLDFLIKLQSDFEKIKMSLANEKSEISKEIENSINKISLIENLNSSIELIKTNEKIVTENVEKSAQEEQILTKLKAEEPVRDKLVSDISKISETLEKYSQLSQKTADYSKNTAEKINKSAMSNDLQKKINQQKEESNEIEKKLNELSNVDIEKTDNSYRIKNSLELEEKLESLIKNHDFCQKQQHQYEQVIPQFTMKNNDYKKISNEYTQMESLFFAEQAGILADKLIVNQPCPVCGSDNHPNPAVKSENAPTQSELKEKKLKTDALREELQKHSDWLNKSKSTLDANKTTLLKQVESHIGSKIEWKFIKEKLEELSANQQSNHKLLTDKQKEISNKLNLKKNLNEKYNNLQKSNENYMTALEKIRTEISDCDKILATLSAEIKGLREILSFESEEKAREELNKMQMDLDSRKSALIRTEDNCKKTSEIISTSTGIVNSEKNKLNNFVEKLKFSQAPTDKIDITPVQKSLEQNKTKLENIDQQISNNQHKIKNNDDVFKDLKNYNAKKEELDKLYISVKELSDTANGELTGKRQKITFETYVQQVYFDLIVDEANSRFRAMSANQYELVRKEEASNFQKQTGLELDVYDYWTGKKRPVKSLSGGQSFMASLSLALGLSDVVQKISGGVELDTMFIDEGFGSLDDQSLEKAMDTIAQLAQGNRLVGIISHVKELKERIDNKIIIEKDKQGSKISTQH